MEKRFINVGGFVINPDMCSFHINYNTFLYKENPHVGIVSSGNTVVDDYEHTVFGDDARALIEWLNSQSVVIGTPKV